MADLRQLINSILTDSKFAKSKNVTVKVYRDEPILRTAAQMANFTPPKYREMRKLAKGQGYYYESDAKVFYQQGKFMEDFTDDFVYQGEFTRYFPTYQCMNDHQLRGYFSWRTKVRQGIIEKTSLAFVFVYLYELLNQIGVSSPEQGFYALKDFWAAYREIDEQISYYLKRWLKDYVVYYQLDKQLYKELSDEDYDDNILVLLNYRQHSPSEVFEALNSLSSYNLANSRLFKQHPQDVQAVVYGIFSELVAYYDKRRKKSICEKFFGQTYINPHPMFRSAVFYQQEKPVDCVYEINEIYKFRCQNGNWSCERFFAYKGRNKQIGSLLKAIDFLMRQKYNFKSSLKTGKTTKIFLDIIDREIEKYTEAQKKAQLPKVEIDLAKLHGIRQSALATQNKLIVEDADLEISTAETAMQQPAQQTELNLNANEYRLLKCLLYQKDYDSFVKEQGLLLSVLVDGINEKLFDLFGDTVIAYGDVQPELVADYIEELKGIIRQ